VGRARVSHSETATGKAEPSFFVEYQVTHHAPEFGEFILSILLIQL
jgi:hypothetical protein